MIRMEVALLRGLQSATKPYVVSVLVLSMRHALKRKQKKNIIVSNCKYQRGGNGRREERDVNPCNYRKEQGMDLEIQKMRVGKWAAVRMGRD